MVCENCGKDHNGSYGSGRFCSGPCARCFSTKNNRDEINRKVSVSLGGTGETKETICENCGTQFRRKNKNAKYCSLSCQHAHQWELYKRKVELIGSFEISLNGSGSKRAKKYLAEVRSDKCEICGITDWLSKPLIKVLDHIDGDAINNKLDNLRLLCSNCDSQLETYKSKNRKSKRLYRRRIDKSL
jgi:hypothetical protein